MSDSLRPQRVACQDCSSPGSSVHGIVQARLMEWVAISFSRRSSRPRDWTQISCIVGRFFTSWATKVTLTYNKISGPRLLKVIQHIPANDRCNECKRKLRSPYPRPWESHASGNIQCLYRTDCVPNSFSHLLLTSALWCRYYYHYYYPIFLERQTKAGLGEGLALEPHSLLGGFTCPFTAPPCKGQPPPQTTWAPSFFLIFIYSAAPSLNCSTRNLWSSLQHSGSLVVTLKLLVATCGI